MKKILLALCLIGLSWQQITAQTFTEVHQLTCGDTAYIGNLGYPTWNVAKIVQHPALGHAILLGDFIPANLLEYTSPPCVVGRDTVVIECAHATQITCDTGIYVFEMTCPENIEPVYPTTLACNDSVYVDNLSGWWAPAIAQQAQHGEARIILEPTDGAGVFYRPDPGFEGLDFVKVSLYNGGDTVLYLFQVYCDLTVGSQVVEPEPLTFFPNPVQQHLYVQDVGNLADVQVFNLRGQNCPVRGTDRIGGYRIETGHLPAGFYFVVIRTKQGGRISGSFVKG